MENTDKSGDNMKKGIKITFGIFFSVIVFTAYADIFTNNQYQKKYSYTFMLKNDAEEEITGLKNIKTVNGITEKEYSVQKDDNIYKITKKTGQSLTVLLLNNPDMEMGSIAASGNVLRVFSGNVITYRKTEDESFSDIDKKFGLSEGETEKLNSGKVINGMVYVKAEESRLKFYLIQQGEKQKLKILHR